MTVSDLARPALRILLLGRLIHHFMLLERVGIFTMVGLTWSHVASGAVTMLIVVQLHKTMNGGER